MGLSTVPDLDKKTLIDFLVKFDARYTARTIVVTFGMYDTGKTLIDIFAGNEVPASVRNVRFNGLEARGMYLDNIMQLVDLYCSMPTREEVNEAIGIGKRGVESKPFPRIQITEVSVYTKRVSIEIGMSKVKITDFTKDKYCKRVEEMLEGLPYKVVKQYEEVVVESRSQRRANDPRCVEARRRVMAELKIETKKGHLRNEKKVAELEERLRRVS